MNQNPFHLQRVKHLSNILKTIQERTQHEQGAKIIVESPKSPAPIIPLEFRKTA